MRTDGDSPTRPVTVQRLRLPSSVEMQELAGKISGKAKLKGSTYSELLHALDAARTLTPESPERNKKLQEVLALAKSWLAKRENSKKAKLDHDDGRQALFLRGLIVDLSDELKQQAPVFDKSERPSAALNERDQLEGRALQPDYPAQNLSKDAKKSYHIVVGVYQQEEKFMELHQERTPSVVRSKFRSALLDNAFNKKVGLFGTRTSKSKGGDEIRKGLIHLAEPKDSKQTARKAARAVIERSETAKGESDKLDEEAREKEIERLSGQTGATGHTWVKLVERANGEDRVAWSFGFWPLGGFGNPTKPVPGVVRHPDRTYEHKSEGVAYLPFEIDLKRFEAALGEADRISKSHPDYVAAGYNCTTFAKDVLSKAGLTLPSSQRIFGVKAVHNPNTVFTAMSSNPAKQGESTDVRFADEAAQDRRIRRALEENSNRQRQVEQEQEKYTKLTLAEGLDKIIFWPGDSFASLEHSQEIHRGDLLLPKFKLLDLDETFTGLHPTAPNRRGEDPESVTWRKVLVVDGPETIGWVRADDVTAI